MPAPLLAFLVVPLLVIAGAANSASVSDTSATISITVPGADDVSREKVSYDCGKQTVAVEYVNAGNVSLALLTIGDEFVVASNVISASGARYTGGRYEWWSKGSKDATLTDLMTDDQTPVVCTAAF
ncbi:MliC family protein [Amorphus sp. 3PC139-8]|uniref:MliC family protein n=1 Tax=Amorphus sp. 3PC139-8 TaxID=2735676 RepID=UPI00345CFD7E